MATYSEKTPETELQALGAGDFCLAYLQGNTVLRVARHAEAAAALQRECLVLSAIADHLPLPVPRLRYHAPADGPAFTSHTLIEGAELTPENWAALGPLEQEQIAAELAGFMRALHAQPADMGRAAGVPVLNAAAWAAELRQASDGLAPLLPPQAWRQLMTLLGHWAAAGEAVAPVLLHRDLAPGHLLYAPETGHLTGVIDFGDLALGEPARDWVYLYDDFGASFLAAVLRHYAPAVGPAETPLGAIRRWYLLETLAWTLEHVSHHDLQWAEGRDALLQALREENES
ncbi:MAG: phosphotransferase family protein [Candidatus Sericytochromatia bacterium]